MTNVLTSIVRRSDPVLGYHHLIYRTLRHHISLRRATLNFFVIHMIVLRQLVPWMKGGSR